MMRSLTLSRKGQKAEKAIPFLKIGAERREEECHSNQSGIEI
jgi:hypothetical protein